MAWFGLDKLFLGVDLDEEQRRSDELDNQIDVQNQFLVERGVWTPDQYAQFEEDKKKDTSAYHQDVVGSVNKEFEAGFEEGLQKEKNFFTGFLDKTLGSLLRVVPWQVWLIGGVALVVWLLFTLGGPGKLVKRFAK